MNFEHPPHPEDTQPAHKQEHHVPLPGQGFENISAEEVLKIISDDFPEFRNARVEPIGKGNNASAFEVNGEYIFRFPARPQEREQFDLQTKATTMLQGKTRAEIPQIEYVGKSTPYAGYRKIKGDMLTEGVLSVLTEKERLELGKDLAHFAHEIHVGVSVEKARQAGLKRAPLIKDARKKEVETLITEEFGGTNEESVFLRILEDAVNYDEHPQKEVLLHGDLDRGNIILDEQTKRLKGVIDFGVSTGDIHREFYFPMTRDKVLADAMIDEYEKVSGEALSRKVIETYAVLRELRWLRRSKENGDTKSFERWKQRLQERARDIIR